MSATITLLILLDDFLIYLKSLNYSKYTIRSAKYNVQSFLRYLSSNHNVETAPQLQRSHLMSWQKFIADQVTTKGLLLKPATLNKKIEGARVYLKYLADHGYIQSVMVQVIRYVKESKFLPCGILSDSEMRQLFKVIDITSSTGIRDRAILELMYSAGLRAGEVVGMHTRSIDFNEGIARVFGKGRKERIVPIGETALMWLEKWFISIRPFMIKPGVESLFVNTYGFEITYETLRRMVLKHADKANLKGKVTTHTFRRSCTTELIKGDANLYHVKDILGHESLETLKHYTKLNVSDLKRTHEKSHPRA